MSMDNPQLPDVGSIYGAPYGRKVIKDGINLPLRCFRLRFIDQCYDEGGAYWGMPANVYCAMNDETQLFIRADNRKEAKRKFVEAHGKLRWVN